MPERISPTLQVEMNPAPNRDLLAFELGLNTNALLWHFDLAAFGFSSFDRVELLCQLARLRVFGARYTEMTSKSPLEAILCEIKGWLPTLDCQWFHEKAETAEYEASHRREEPLGSEFYFQELRPAIPDFRQRLPSIIIDHVLSTPRQRMLFALGVLIDSGQHSPEVAHHTLDPVSDSNARQDTPSGSWGDERNDVIQPTRIGERSFRSGEFPVVGGWSEQIHEYRTQLELNCTLDSPQSLSTQEARLRAVSQLVESFRIALGSTTEVGISIEPIDAKNPRAASHQSIDELPISAHPVADPIAPEIGDASNIVYGGDDTGPRDNSNTNDTSEPDEVCERFGKWKFTPAMVTYDNTSPFVLVDNLRELLKCMVKTKAIEGWVTWTNLAEVAWPKDSDPDRKAVITGICRLNRTLKAKFSDRNTENPIESIGSKQDLAYRLTPALR